MRSLLQAYPDLRLPHLALGRLPTRVHRLDAVSRETGAEVWVKRDDESGARYGGNKVRKLELLLAEARRRGATRIVTLGAAGSHHVLATGLYAAQVGISVTGVLVPQPPTEHVGRNVLADLGAGIDLVPARSDAEGVARFGAAIARATLSDRRRPFVVMIGGSSPRGTLGYVDAALELAAQVRAGELPEPDAIFVALGSGSTAAGLHLGLHLAGLRTEVVAVRVTQPLLSREELLAFLARRSRALLARSSRLVPEGSVPRGGLRIEGGQLGRGYGHATAASDAALRLAAELEGLQLDPTYTAKTFAALVAHARDAGRGRTLLFWHTLSAADISDLVEKGRACAVPAALRVYTDLVTGRRG